MIFLATKRLSLPVQVSAGGGDIPWKLTKFKIIKRIKVLESIFSIISIEYFAKSPFIEEKFRNIEHTYFTNFTYILEKIFLKLKIFYIELLFNYFILQMQRIFHFILLATLGIHQKAHKIGLDPEGTIGKGMKILESLGENRLSFVEELGICNQNFMKNFNLGEETTNQHYAGFDQNIEHFKNSKIFFSFY